MCIRDSPSFSAADITEPMVHLPASVHTTFAMEIESTKIVNEICIGENIQELREA